MLAQFKTTRKRHLKKYLLAVIALLVVSVEAMSDASMPAGVKSENRFEHLYNSLLNKYWRPSVTINGIATTVFDYAAMASDASKPNSLFSQIASSLALVDTTVLPHSNQSKAFWINAYNFGAMRMIVEHYPVDSITSFKISLLKHPWSKKSLRIGNQDYSLTEIEKDILLKDYDDPRIIFAVSCAAVSCPDRTAQAFSGESLDDQLNNLIREFFRNPGKGLLLDRKQEKVTLSWIFKKDAHLFGDDIMAFVMDYLEPESQSWLKTHAVAIDYFNHDWTLNDLAQAE